MLTAMIRPKIYYLNFSSSCFVKHTKKASSRSEKILQRFSSLFMVSEINTIMSSILSLGVREITAQEDYQRKCEENFPYANLT